MQPDQGGARRRDMTETVEATEATLIARTLAGDMRAFEVLVERHQGGVASFIWRIVPDRLDREEVCQEVFIKAWRNLNRFKGDAAFSTWLYTIAWRTAISLVRKRRVDYEVFDESLVHGTEDRGAETVEMNDLLDDAIATLSPEERGILTLFHARECTIEEIAAIVDRPSGTIKSILARSRSKLKAQLEETLR